MIPSHQAMYKRIRAFKFEHNSAQKKAAHKITKNRANTLKVLARLSIQQAYLAIQSPSWADSDTIPSVWTSREELAELADYCPRTAYNCLAVLEDAGIIQKINHGWQTAFEIVLHPWFVFGDCYNPPQVYNVELEQKKEKRGSAVTDWESGRIKPVQSQNLPPIISDVTIETSIISTNSGVDCGKLWKKQTFRVTHHNPRLVDDSRIDNRKGNEAQNQEESKDFGQQLNLTKEIKPISHRKLQKIVSIGQLILPLNNDKGNETGGELQPGLTNPSAPSARSTSTTTDHGQPDLSNLGKQLTMQFWEKAKNQLWPEEFISEDYEKRLLNLVWTDVMGGFSDCTTDSAITTRYFLRLRQLEMATTYAHKHGWTSFLPPPMYFSRSQFIKEKQSGKRGSFWWTYEWVKETDTKKKDRIRKEKLQQAIHSVVACKAPKSLKNGNAYDRISLYQYWRNRLAKMGDQQIVDEFDYQISQHRFN
jgi:hypothetical protein